MGKAKLNIPMCAALLLLLLTMISIHLTSGLYARYTATVTSSDSARVAKFQVLGSAQETMVTIDYSGTENGEYSFTVTNNSEVAVRYSIIVEFTEPVAATFLLVKLDDSQYGVLSNKTATFSQTNDLNPNGAQKTHTLQFVLTSKEFFDLVQGEDSVTKALNFTIKIHAEQID